MIAPYFCARYYGRNTVRKVTVNGRIRTVSFDLGSQLFPPYLIYTAKINLGQALTDTTLNIEHLDGRKFDIDITEILK
jgi:hypothetical protein